MYREATYVRIHESHTHGNHTRTHRDTCTHKSTHKSYIAHRTQHTFNTIKPEVRRGGKGGGKAKKKDEKGPKKAKSRPQSWSDIRGGRERVSHCFLFSLFFFFNKKERKIP
jgi:hypothetical protein